MQLLQSNKAKGVRGLVFGFFFFCLLTQCLGDYFDNYHRALKKFEDVGREWSADPVKHNCFIRSSFPCEKHPEAHSCSPNFIIFGAPKCGTTSLYEYLASHPQVARALDGYFDKEVRFFSEHYQKGFDWYLQQFPPVNSKSVVVNNDASRVRVMSGEASPTYIFEKNAPKRIKENIPNVKLIVLLREPVRRIISYWGLLRGQKMVVEGQKLEKELVLQMDRFRHCFNFDRTEKLERKIEVYHTCFLNPATLIEYDKYLLQSIYVYQLANWLQYFNQSQIMVFKSEDFFEPSRIVGNMERVTNFLGLCPIDWKPIVSQVHNKAPVSLEGVIDAEGIHRMRTFFKPFNDELGKLLGMNFDSWNDS